MDEIMQENIPVGGGSDKKKKEKLTARETLYEIFEELCYVAALVVLFFLFIGRMATVQGSSMANTLQDEDGIFVSNLFYTPDRYDIVVVDKEEGYYADELLIKRVIAKGGETVTINYNTWTVVVDGLPLYEPYVLREDGMMDREDMVSDTFVVPEGCYFVMGDNRNGSTDSRSELVGFVKASEILGRAVFRVSPPQSMGFLK
ncbi:MAG: signal peptidase I [Clostridia bacterium]|nr:signal peptidase I [Clostridia bacterium]